MFKRRIEKWGLDKNNKEREMKAIARKHHQRAAQQKASIFRVRGKKVDYPEIMRYFARKHVSIPDIVAQRAASRTPEAVACLTPVLSTVTTPSVVALPELLFSTIRDYMSGSFDSGTWIKTEASHGCCSIKESSGVTIPPLCIIQYRCREANNLLETGAIKEAELVLDSIESHVSQVLLTEDPELLCEIFENLIYFYRSRKTMGAALRVISMIASEARILGQHHPLRRIFECFQKIDPSRFTEAGIRCGQLIADHFEKSLGAMHATSLLARCRTDAISSKTLGPLLHRCQAELGIYDLRTLGVHIALAWNLYNEDRYALACVACREVFTTASQVQGTEEVQDSDDLLNFRAQSLRVLALCQRFMNEDRYSKANMREAINLRIFHYGPWDSEARSLILELRNWLIEDGQAEEEAEAWQWWNLIAHPPAERQNTIPGSTGLV